MAKNGTEKTIAIAFGSEDGAIGSDYVFNAAMEAMQQGFGPLFLFGFATPAPPPTAARCRYAGGCDMPFRAFLSRSA